LPQSQSVPFTTPLNIFQPQSVQDVVIFRDGAELTLEQVFQSLKVTAYDLSIDTLDMHAHSDSFHRFDKFNLKYNPIGESRLREIFLKTDNYIQGRYLAELTKGGYFPSSLCGAIRKCISIDRRGDDRLGAEQISGMLAFIHF
jgi:AMP deaminase